MNIGSILFLKRKASTQNQIIEVLEDLNCMVHYAESIIDAEQLSSQFKIDLIIISAEEEDNDQLINFAISNNQEDIPLIFLAFNSNRIIYDAVKQANLIAYLVSPVDTLTLRSIVESTIGKIKKEEDGKHKPPHKLMEDTLFIKVNQLLQKVDIDNISHIQSEGNYCLIFTSEKKYAIKLSMIRLNQTLAMKGFRQVHKSYLVQLNKIEHIDISSNEVIIGDLRIPLGRKYKQELLSYLNLL